MIKKMLIDVNEASSILISFIGSDKYEEIVKCIQDNAKAGFTAGLSYALCLIMAECTKYSFERENNDNGNT